MNGQAINDAVDKLTVYLSVKAVRATEITQITIETGISYRTLTRAKRMIGAKSKKIGSEWFWYIPENTKPYIRPIKEPAVRANLPIISIDSREQCETKVSEQQQFDTENANRIFLICGVSGFSGKFDAFSVRVPAELQTKMMIGDTFVFCNCSRNQISILHWHGGGFAQYFKRTDFGKFPWSVRNNVGAVEITAEDLRMLLEYPQFVLRLSGISTSKKSS